MTTQENKRLKALNAFEIDVMSGEFPGDKTGPEMGFPDISAALLYDAYSGSLDAAFNLHECVLSDWRWKITDTPDATLFPPKKLARLGHLYADSTLSGHASRAWLLAIIRALIAIELDRAQEPQL